MANYKKNRKTLRLHEEQANEWDNKTRDLSFQLHPLNRVKGQLRSYFPCGHHITFPSKVCHEDERAELLEKGLL